MKMICMINKKGDVHFVARIPADKEGEFKSQGWTRTTKAKYRRTLKKEG